ncbi:hypothetical protein EDD21DRAFT_402356 [Dissophora ornata]|nr:hypothetical protein EDD21DRAFT_402356 [Dissophora ornata]
MCGLHFLWNTCHICLSVFEIWNGIVVADFRSARVRAVVSSEDATLGTFMILFGLVLVFFGFKLIRVTLFLTGFLSWAIVVIIIIATSRWDLAWMLFKPSYYYFWMWLLAGFIGGVLSFRFWDLGMIIAGGFGGFALGMGIIGAANDSIPMFGRYILLIGVIVLGATVAVFWERLSIILATSFAGAFMVMFGVDEFLQVGYREMMVIFEFAGKALTYHPDKKVYIMIGSSLALACLGIVWELLLHRTPFWEDRKVLFSVYGQPFGKRPLRLVGQKIMNGVRRKTAEDVLQGGDDSYVDGNGHVVVGESQSQLPVSSELEEVTVEKPSEGSDTEVSNDSGISSMTPSSYRDHTDANTELPIDSALPPITLSPIQIVIDDAEFEDSSSDKTVPVGTHIESACRISTDSTATHHTTITTTTIATASRSISSSEITSHQHASSTPDAL